MPKFLPLSFMSFVDFHLGGYSVVQTSTMAPSALDLGRDWMDLNHGPMEWISLKFRIKHGPLRFPLPRSGPSGLSRSPFLFPPMGVKNGCFGHILKMPLDKIREH